MKKIAFIVRLFQIDSFYAGGEKFIYKTISEFIKNGYTVDIWCNETNISKADGINEIIICNDVHSSSDPLECMQSYYDLMNDSIKKRDYDLVISDGITPYSDIILLQVHTMQHKRLNQKNFLKYYYYKKFKPYKIKQIAVEEKWLKQEHKKIFVVSNVLKNDLIKNFNIPADKISVIYPGVDMLEETVPQKHKSDSFKFGISATFFKRKGGFVFLWAVIIAKLRGYNFKVSMILRNTSKTRWIKVLLKIFNIEKNVKFLPFQNKMTDFYSQIDCLVMPSEEEAFGLVALEGMINKIPVIISSTSGIAELIEDGQNGFVFDLNHNSAFNLAEKMIFLSKSPELTEKCVQNAYNTATKYNWDRTFEKIEKELGLIISSIDL
jgi:glycosyltransferase involved in cell wall biosynthesis